MGGIQSGSRGAKERLPHHLQEILRIILCSQLAEKDGDLFNRWQALQEYAMRLLTSASRALARGKAPKWDAKFLAACVATAGDETLEPAYRALALALPGEGEIAQALARNVDPDAVWRARTALMAQMGEALEPVRLAIAPQLETPGPFDPCARDAGRRSLNNILLTLAVIANIPAAEAQSIGQYDTADNMNDRFAALQRIVHFHASRKATAEAVARFEERHGQDPLVMDKWFAVQATAAGKDAAGRIEALMKHKAFSMRNPNRVRSVIGAFASGNPTGFNAADGSGYRLVGQAIAELDAINPQVAARMLTAFRSFRVLETGRRRLAQEALEELRGRGALSRDTSDILERTLEAE